MDPKFALAPGLGRSFYAATRKDDGQLHLDTLAQAEVASRTFDIVDCMNTLQNFDAI